MPDDTSNRMGTANCTSTPHKLPLGRREKNSRKKKEKTVDTFTVSMSCSDGKLSPLSHANDRSPTFQVPAVCSTSLTLPQALTIMGNSLQLVARVKEIVYEKKIKRYNSKICLQFISSFCAKIDFKLLTSRHKMKVSPYVNFSLGRLKPYSKAQFSNFLNPQLGG